MSVNFGDLEQQYNLPSGLLSAVQRQESGGDPNAVSPKGAIGAFQFEPATAEQYGIDPTDPDQAAHGAAMMFGDLSKKYKGDVPSMLAAYNWGQGNLDRKGMENAPVETQNYIQSIQGRLPQALPAGTQYATADTGNMTDAGVYAPPHPSTMSEAQIDAELAKLQGGQQQKDPSAMTEAELDAELSKLQGDTSLIDALKYQTTPGRAAYQGVMNTVAKPINNAVNSAMGAATAPISYAAHPLAGAIDSTGAGQWIGDKLLGASGMASDAIAPAVAELKDLESYNSDLAHDLGALGQNAQLAGNMSLLKSPLGAVGNAGQDVAASRQAANAIVKAHEGVIPSSAIKTASKNAYKYSENVGGVLHPDNFTNPVLDIIDKAKAKPIAGKVLTSEQKALNAALDEYSPLRDSPLTLEDFQNFDKSLTAKESAAMDGFKPTNNSRIIGQVQDDIRDRLQSLHPSDVIGGKEGFDALTQHAIPLWSTQTKMADLETLLNKANGTANPTQATKSALNNFMNSQKFNNYPAAAKAAIKQAAKRGNADDLLGILGSRLNPIIAGASGPTGMATEMATSSAARWGRNAMQSAKNNKIMKAMTDPVRESVKKFSTLPESPYPLKPEVPVEPVNPYINPNAKSLDKYLPNDSGKVALEPVEPVNPEPQGTSSTYYATGGIVKNRESHLSKKLEAKLGRVPKKREIELATYVTPHGVHRLLKQKDDGMAAHKMFPEATVKEHRALFFNKKKPYTVEQIKAVLG